MSIRVEIIAADAEELASELVRLARHFGGTVSSYAVDTDDTYMQTKTASPVELADEQLSSGVPAPRKRGRPPKSAQPAVPPSTVEPEADAPGEAATDPEPDTGAADTPSDPKEELKEIVNRLTTFATQDSAARAHIATWRDERGLKWIRELNESHIPDARALVAELESMAS